MRRMSIALTQLALISLIPAVTSAAPLDRRSFKERAMAAISELFSEGEETTEIPENLLAITGTRDTWAAPSKLTRMSQAFRGGNLIKAEAQFNVFLHAGDLTSAFKLARQSGVPSRAVTFEGESLLVSRYRISTYGSQSAVPHLVTWYQELALNQFNSNQIGEEIVLIFEHLNRRMRLLAEQDQPLLLEFQSNVFKDSSPLMHHIYSVAFRWFANKTASTPDGGHLVLMSTENTKKFADFLSRIYVFVLADAKQIWAFEHDTSAGRERLLDIYRVGEKTAHAIEEFAQKSSELEAKAHTPQHVATKPPPFQDCDETLNKMWKMLEGELRSPPDAP